MAEQCGGGDVSPAATSAHRGCSKDSNAKDKDRGTTNAPSFSKPEFKSKVAQRALREQEPLHEIRMLQF